ncbi:MAG: hypothetical protein OEV53_13915 [Nitrospira sp.]|nr:hypothetical protein [Nitrospira sp.]MDH5194566.1 hypothetical protein [Nitrospira sp.]
MTLLFTTANTRIFLLVANLFFGTLAGPEAGDLTLGPAIKVIAPKENMVQIAPFDIDIRFEQRGAAVVDLASLKILLIKLWNVDITDRMKPYASGDGIHLTHADFPKGQHTIKIAIADHEGHESSRTMPVMVQ